MGTTLDPGGIFTAAPRRRCTPASADGPGAFADTLARVRSTARRVRARRAASGLPQAQLDGPPPEVEREMAAAADVARTLAAQGKEVRFDRTADGRVSVELIDLSGRPSDLTPSGLFSLLEQ
jgi:hypothetical protein